MIGSHGQPRDKDNELDTVGDAAKIKARIAASSQIVRIEIGSAGAVPAIKRTSKLRDVIIAQSALRPFVDRRLENNGLTIEGIAVRHGRILAGFRAPTLEDGRAAVLSVAIDGMFGDDAPDAKLHRLRLGDGQSVRDLAPFGNGIVVLAGPSAGGPGTYALYWWDGESDSVRFLKELSDAAGGDRSRKPEALLPLDIGPSGLRA